VSDQLPPDRSAEKPAFEEPVTAPAELVADEPRSSGLGWATGAGVGIGVGVAFGVARDDPIAGLALGVGIGIALALAFAAGRSPR
jgi:hypothetical protein